MQSSYSASRFFKSFPCVLGYIWLFTVSGFAFSKTTYTFSGEPIDVVIPCSHKDQRTLEQCIQSTRQHVQNLRRIIVISKEPLTSSAEWFDEQNYPFSKETVALEIFSQDITKAQAFLQNRASRIGWIYQQLLKLYAFLVIPDISSNILIVDADVIWLNPIEFLTTGGEPFLTVAKEYHDPYFKHMKRLIPELNRACQYSGVAHHMMFQKPVLIDLFQTIQSQQNTDTWKAICHCIDHKYLYASSFSEYEIYFNFIFLRTDQAHLRHIKWANCSLQDLPKYRKRGYAYVACHSHLKPKKGSGK